MAGELARARQNLEAFWSSPQGEETKKIMKEQMKKLLKHSELAKCLKEQYKAGVAWRDAMNTCVNRFNLSQKLIDLWGTGTATA